MKVKQNPDKEYVKSIREQLKANNGYCPCVLEKTPDSKCMCKEFRDMIDRGETGTCHCGLYIAEED
ncbi:MAG: hypothetical protein IKA04_03190 [Alistipes sp.]|nr:hypothetical protein [Alistipes sp.]